MIVKNLFPIRNAPYKIALIGEAPGKEEDEQGIPFVGYSGRLLDSFLNDAGIVRDACFIGNVCQVRPPDNNLKKFQWLGPEIQSGIAQLKKDLTEFDPYLIVPLGGTALHVAKTDALLKAKPPFPISDWRGSLFWSSIFDRKCLSVYHPAAIARVFKDSMITRYDFRRIRKEGESRELVLPERTIIWDPTFNGLMSLLNEVYADGNKISIDIEGWCGDLKCISIATSPKFVFCVQFQTIDGSSRWTHDEEVEIWYRLIKILTDPNIPKVLQSGLYDRYVLAWPPYNILVRGIADDTMLKHWEHQCEMDKSLAFQTSFYTREPFYKSGRWARDAKTFFTYNCLDSAVTYECNEKLEVTISGSSVSHYRFNMALQNPVLYMELRGIRFDIAKRDNRIAQLQAEADERQRRFNSDIGMEINVKSWKQVAVLLYDVLKLPVQYKRQIKKADDERKVTTEYEAVLKLYLKTKDRRLMDFIKLKEVYKRISDLKAFKTDRDGRIRFSYNLVGSSTGRISCSESPSNSGTAGQTVRKEDRDLFLGNLWFERDLSGADGWTVACHCARLGDPTMLDDLLYGLKIPKLIGLIVKYGIRVNFLDRAELKRLSDEIDKKAQIYIAFKQTQHGTNYLMSYNTVALRVINETYGEYLLKEDEAKLYQQAYLSRYKGIPRWHDWMREQIRKGFYISATGHKHIICGRKDDNETLRSLLSDEPQQVTTYTTNLALKRSWEDPCNRAGSHLLIQPLHQVHDALCFEHPDKEFTEACLREWFNNTINIAGIPVVIPADGGCGPSWGELE